MYLQSGATEADIQKALTALPDGGTLVLPKGAVISVSAGLVADVSHRSITLDLNGSTLKQAGDVTVLIGKGAHVAGAAATLGSDGAGHTTITYTGAAQAAAGGWVKVYSDTPLPLDDAASATMTRLGQAMQVTAVNGNTLTLAGGLLYADQYQANVRASAYQSGKLVIENGTIEGDQSHTTWLRDLLEVRSTVGAMVDHVTVKNGNSMGINIVDSVAALASNDVVKNLKDNPAAGNYGYGVHSASSVGTTVVGLYAEQVRHATDDNAVSNAAGDRDPSHYGADIGMTVKDSIAVGTTSYAYDWHSEGREAVTSNVIAVNSYGMLGGRGVDNSLTDSAGYGNTRGLLFYEYEQGDGRDIKVDGVSLRATHEYVTMAQGGAVLNQISNSYLEVIGANQDVSAAASLTNTVITRPTGLNETLTGTAGADKLLGGDGVDLINGGAGDDFIWGGAGADTLTGGAGSDRFAYFDSSEGGDVITDFKAGVGGDVIDLSVMAKHYGWTGDPVTGGYAEFVRSGADTVVAVDVDGGGDHFQTLAVLKGVAPTQLTYANLTVDVERAANAGLNPVQIPTGLVIPTTVAPPPVSIADPFAQITGYATLVGSAGADTIISGNAASLIIGGPGNDRLQGGAGDDMLAGGAGADTLLGGAGRNAVTYLDAKAGVHASLTSPATNTGDAAGDHYGQVADLVGSALADVMEGNTGANRLSGGDGNDRLLGLAGADTLDGGKGDDVLIGGAGSDVLTGGSGADSFVFNLASEGSDRITDFTPGMDHIALSATGFGLSSLSQLHLVSGAHPAAADLHPTLLYNTASGVLAWDPDGSGAQHSVVLASLDGLPHLALSDILLI